DPRCVPGRAGARDPAPQLERLGLGSGPDHLACTLRQAGQGVDATHDPRRVFGVAHGALVASTRRRTRPVGVLLALGDQEVRPRGAWCVRRAARAMLRSASNTSVMGAESWEAPEAGLEPATRRLNESGER